MKRDKPPHEWSRLRLRLITFVLIVSAASPIKAITIDQVDDFQDNTNQNWGGGSFEVVANAGPNGTGDFTLHVAAHGGQGGGGKLVIYNQGAQWDGNWTAAGVAQIAMDVRNPNAFPLDMRVGIAGPGGFSVGGTGDAHVSTNPISIPADDAWHSVVFPVLAADFTSLNEPSGINAALADVTHFRILHNPAIEFIGAQLAGSFYVDNVRALGASELLPGDYNEDGVVDAADYVVWRKNDGSGTGYAEWKTNFGRIGSGGGHFHGSGLVTNSVPEPGTPLLLLAIFFSAAALRCRGAR